jgi:hypothetical protein
MSAAGIDEGQIRRCIPEPANRRRDQDRRDLKLDERPLQGAFLIPPAQPVVLIRTDSSETAPGLCT